MGIRKIYVSTEKCNPEGRLKDGVQDIGSSILREFRAINAPELKQALCAEKNTLVSQKSYQMYSKYPTDIESPHY